MADNVLKSQLHEVPLDIAEDAPEQVPSRERISVSNSIRRFFKMAPLKKKVPSNDGDEPIAQNSAVENIDENDAVIPSSGQDIIEPKVADTSNGEPVARRFNLRLVSHRHEREQPMTSAASENTLPQSCSIKPKGTLRGSISKYWSSMFKFQFSGANAKDETVTQQENNAPSSVESNSQGTSGNAEPMPKAAGKEPKRIKPKKNQTLFELFTSLKENVESSNTELKSENASAEHELNNMPSLISAEENEPTDKKAQAPVKEEIADQDYPILGSPLADICEEDEHIEKVNTPVVENSIDV